MFNAPGIKAKSHTRLPRLPHLPHLPHLPRLIATIHVENDSVRFGNNKKFKKMAGK
jgi:hypothetical protein